MNSFYIHKYGHKYEKSVKSEKYRARLCNKSKALYYNLRVSGTCVVNNLGL